MFNVVFRKFNMLPLGLMRGAGSSEVVEEGALPVLIIWGQEVLALIFL